MNAVLNANYMMEKLKDLYTVAYPSTCMNEFVVSMEKEKDEQCICQGCIESTVECRYPSADHVFPADRSWSADDATNKAYMTSSQTIKPLAIMRADKI